MTVEQKPVITLRQLGAKIGSRVRFVEDPPDVWRTVETEEQLDYGHMLPWIVEAAKPEPTYTREQVQQVLEAAAECHGKFLMTKTSVDVLDVVISEEAIRAIDIDAVVGGE